MQHAAAVVDRWGMRSLAVWLVVIAGVGVGWASTLPSAAWVPLAMALAGLGLCLSLVPGRARAAAFAGGIACLALARGATAQRSSTIVADRRGMPGITREVRVEAASTPGPRCVVTARTARGSPVELALPADACPLGWGDRLLVPSADLHTDAAHASPDDRGALFISASWRRPRPALVWWARVRASVSRRVARVRQAGWVSARGDTARGFVVASSLGLTTALPPEVRARLQRAGLGHLVAVSGLHVGLAALAWLAALRMLLASRWWGSRAAVVASSFPVVAYVLLTGAGAPAVRAAIMFGLVGLGSVLGRTTHGPSVLLVAVALMVFARPHWLVEPGFQLSVAAMVVLVGLPSGASASFTSWHLGWALLPLLWLHFDASSDGSVLANAIAMPVFALWVVPLAIAGWGVLPLLGPAALDPAAAGAAVILEVADVVSSWPEIPRAVWVGAAAVAWMPFVRRRMSPRGLAWMPHRGAALLLLMVAVGSEFADEPSPGWTAWSGGRRPEVLAVDARGYACVRAPARSASTWRSRLAREGARDLGGVQLDPSARVDDPARVAWRRALRRGSVRRGVPPCRPPDHTHVQAALERCAAFSPTPAARRAPDQPLQCWSARLGAWRSAPLHLPWPTRS